MKRVTLIGLVMMGGCVASVVEGGSSGTSGTSETSGTSGTSGPAAAESSSGSTASSDPGTTNAETSSSSTGAWVWETEGADEGYATTGNCGFTCPPPPGPGGGFGCNFSDQDCSEGEKCAPWANDGGLIWNALRCVPVDVQPDTLGEACVVEGSFVSGVDTCGAGLACTPSDADSLFTNDGVCTQLCNAGPCPDGTLCTVPGTLNVGACGQICDPLAQDACPTGQGCLPAGLGFACHLAFDTTNDEPCTAAAECGLGHACLEASQCGDEPGDACCVQLCNLGAPNCQGGQSCTDYGSPLAAYATVGFCEG